MPWHDYIPHPVVQQRIGGIKSKQGRAELLECNYVLWDTLLLTLHIDRLPDAGAAHSGDGLSRLSHTGHQQLKQVLQHQVDQTLIANVYGTPWSQVRRNLEQSINFSTDQQIKICTRSGLYPSTNAKKQAGASKICVKSTFIISIQPTDKGT